MGTTKRNEKEKDGKKSRSSSSSGSSAETEGKTQAPERRTREKSTDVEAVPSPRGKETSDRRPETKESAKPCFLKDARKRRRSRERRERTERRSRSESQPKSRRGRSPEKSSFAKLRVPDTRTPAHPTQPPPKKNRGGSGGSGGSKERCPICWQRVSHHQSGKDQHMWSNQICIAYQIWNQQKNKDWAAAKKQAKELKEHRASQAEAAPLLVSKETKLAAEKAHARTAAWVRGVSKQPDRVDSSSRSPARVKKPKAKRRPPSPTPSPPPPERRRKKPRSSSDSSSRPRRHSRRERRIVINVK